MEDGSAGEALTLAESLERASKLKTEGNVLFKRGVTFAQHTLGKESMTEACSKYALALSVLREQEDTNGPSVAQSEEHRALTISILLNLAASGLRLDSPDSAANCCDAVLELVPGHAKALFRRGQARAALGKLDQAIDDLRAAYMSSGGGSAARDAKAEYLRVKARKEEEVRKAAFEEETAQGRERRLREESAGREQQQANENNASGLCEIEELNDEEETTQSEDNAETRSALEKTQHEESEPLSLELLEMSEDWIKGAELEAFTSNGAVLKDYAWGQTLDSLHVVFRIDPRLSGRDLECNIRRTSFEVAILFEQKKHNILGKSIHLPVTVDECVWELEERGCLHVVLAKENSTRERTQGFEWWPCLFQGDPGIDLAECNVGSDLRELPRETRQKMERAMWEEANMSPEERAAAEEKRKVEKKMADEQARIKASVEPAISANPGKKAVYEMMQEKFPDIPVEFR